MTNAYRDENSVPTLIASSSVDGKTPVRVYADPITHRLLVDDAGQASSGIEAPTSTPARIGLIYVDTVAVKVYISTGNASSADWTLIN